MKVTKATPTKTPSAKDLLEHYEQGLDVTFPTTPHAAYERRLIFDHLVEPPLPLLASVTRRSPVRYATFSRNAGC